MTIALTACDSKKELMVQFCIAYAGVLSKHHLFATSTTGRMVSEVTGLEVQRCLSEKQGGIQQLVSKICCNEVDLLLFFRENSQYLQQSGGFELIQACDNNSIPAATNIATAEILIHGLERGDFDWRNGMR